MTPIHAQHRCARGRFRGFSLVEMMAVVALMGSFAALTGETFVTITSVTRDSNRAQVVSHHFDAIVRKLRADVWRATSIRTPDDSTAVLEVPLDRRVTWNITGDGTVSRRVDSKTGNAAAEITTWEKFNLPLRFSTRNGALLVASSQQDHSLTDELVLVSQMNLAVRRQP